MGGRPMWPRQPSASPEGKRSAKGEQLVLRAARPAKELPQVLRVIPLPAHMDSQGQKG